jgi:hypothetical protein
MIADQITVAMFSKKTDDSDRAEDFATALRPRLSRRSQWRISGCWILRLRGLSDNKKAHKRYMQQQIGARVNDYKRGLQRRLEGPAE